MPSREHELSIEMFARPPRADGPAPPEEDAIRASCVALTVYGLRIVSSFGPILAALVEGGGRFVVVGGLATVLQGYARLTVDVDVMVDLADGEAIKPVAALSRIGMLPRAPVEAREFADPAARRQWVDEKGMRVFSMWDPRRPLLEVDLFVDPPIPFEDVWTRSEATELDGHRIRVACIADLVALKRIAGRPKDIEDIAALEAIAKRKGP